MRRAADLADELRRARFVHLAGAGLATDDALALAHEVVRSATGARLDLVGDFRIPAAGTAGRSFQALHIDFALPLAPAARQDVALCTALHVPHDVSRSEPPVAATRLVPLGPLLAQRAWPPAAGLLARFERYGRTHGAWADADGYAEGILGRIAEAAAGGDPRLPSVRLEPDFLCGTEFASAAQEEAFLADLGLDVGAVATDVVLAPGDLLVFDNLAVAHGRRGPRRPEELQQWVLGRRALPRTELVALRARFLELFAPVDGPATIPR